MRTLSAANACRRFSRSDCEAVEYPLNWSIMLTRFLRHLPLAVWVLQAPYAFGQEPAWASGVDSVFQRFQRSNGPGCAAAVVEGGKVTFRRAYGMANLDHGVALSPDSVFHVASVSKEFTAAAIQLLVQDGKLSLDDPARKYVTELPDFGKTITIRHLIHHTSGLRDQWSLLGLAGWRYSLDLITDEDVLAMVARQRELNFPPGQQYMYCNTGYTLLAQIVKRVSGMSFRDFAGKRIFKPLGMLHSHFREDHGEVIRGNAYGYVPAGARFRLSLTNFDTAGATSLHTTVDDLALWIGELETDGLGIGKAMRVKGRLNNGQEIPYASGLIHGAYRGLDFIGHGGSDAGYRSNLAYFPAGKTGVIALCNDSTADPSALTRRVADVVLAAKLGPKSESPKTTPVPREVWDRYSGVWVNRVSDHIIRIEASNGMLRVAGMGPGAALGVIEGNRLAAQGRPGEFRFSGAGMESVSPGSETESYERVAAPAFAAGDFQKYAGTYTSPEMDAVYRIAWEGGELALHRLRSAVQKLRPVEKDLFESNFGSFRFTRDAAGSLNGFVINSTRIRNVRFSRAGSESER